jgi:uncharacterized protein
MMFNGQLKIIYKPGRVFLLIFLPVILLTSGLPRVAAAQSSEDINLVSGLIETPGYQVHYKVHREKNIIQTVSRALFVFYKNFVSSQDGSHCTFSPSCSEYAIQSIQKKGIFSGLLSTFDRLARCNGMSPENYPAVKGGTQLYDPVR